MQALMVRYQAGDSEAFDALYRALAPLLRRHLLRLARDPSRVDDLVQETFLHIHQARRTYDPERPLPPWARAIATHVFLMDCRYRRRRAERLHVPLDEGACTRMPQHEDVVDARRTLDVVLKRLSPGVRRCVVLHHVTGLNFEDIAAKLHIAGSSARARASRGVAQLRRLCTARPSDAI